MPVKIDDQKFFQIQEAANKLGVSRQTLQRWFREGKATDVSDGVKRVLFGDDRAIDHLNIIRIKSPDEEFVYLKIQQTTLNDQRDVLDSWQPIGLPKSPQSPFRALVMQDLAVNPLSDAARSPEAANLAAEPVPERASALWRPGFC